MDPDDEQQQEFGSPPVSAEAAFQPEPEPERPESVRSTAAAPAVEPPRPIERLVERVVPVERVAPVEPGGELFGGDPRARSADPAFRVVELRATSDGRITARLRRELVTRVYRVPTAIRFTRYEASQMPADDAVLVLLRPSGTCVGVYASGSGRKAPARVASRARRMVRDLMPELFARTKKRRTSRRATAVRPRVRRTSRPAKGAAPRKARRSR